MTIVSPTADELNPTLVSAHEPFDNTLFEKHYGPATKMLEIGGTGGNAAQSIFPKMLTIWEQEDGSAAFEDLPSRALIDPVSPLTAPGAMMRVFIAIRDGEQNVLYHVVGWDNEKAMYIADRMG